MDLTSIDGIDVITAQTIVSEIGTDMSGFPTENHFASWLGLAPRKDISGGKIIGTGKKQVQNRVAMALRMAATTLVKQQDLPGKPLSTLAQATALLCGSDQGHGPLSGGAGLPPTHPRRGLGGSRRRAVRAEAQRTGTGDSELQSSGERIQAGSHHSSKLTRDAMHLRRGKCAIAAQGQQCIFRSPRRLSLTYSSARKPEIQDLTEQHPTQRARVSGEPFGKTGLFSSAPNATTPAKPGETIVLYGTGFGATSPALTIGRLADRLAPLTAAVNVTIGGVPATVSFAGLVPPFAQLYQLNVQVPPTVAAGDQPVVAQVGGVTSPTDGSCCFITIQQ